MKRDSQRARVYRWQQAEIPGIWVCVPLEDCAQLITMVCRDIGFKTPVVMAKRGHLSMANTRNIWLSPKGQTFVIALHELAHSITQRVFGIFGDSIAGHGPEFVRMFLWLLEHYYDGPGAQALSLTPSLYGVKVSSYGVVDVIFDRLAYINIVMDKTIVHPMEEVLYGKE